MKAIQGTAFAGPKVMNLVDVPDPMAKEGFAIIDVTAIGI